MMRSLKTILLLWVAMLACLTATAQSVTSSTISSGGMTVVLPGLNTMDITIGEAVIATLGSPPNFTHGFQQPINLLMITNISSPNTLTYYKAGAVIPITLTFNQPVMVTGSPELSLNSGGKAIYSSESTSTTLTFNYTVADGENSAKLDYSEITSLTLAGGSLKNTVGMDALLTLATPGEPGSLSANKNFVIDTQAPDAPTTPILATTSDSGLSNSDGITNVVTPEITGTAEDGSMVTLYSGTNVIGSVIATGGNWSITADPLVEGIHAITAKAADVAGNESAASSAVTVAIDTTAPTIPVGLITTAGDAQIILNWNANPEIDVSKYQIFYGTTASPATLLSDIAAGTTTYTNTALTNGTTYYYQIRTVDIAGNISPSSTNVTGVPQKNQTISFNAIANKIYGAVTFSIGDANSSVGLPITYTATDPDIVSISGNMATILKAGSTTITASQLGNTSVVAATDVMQTLTIDKQGLTIVNTNRSKVYGELLAETDFDGSITGLVYNDDITLTRNSIGANASADAGTTYPIVAMLADPDNKLVNYTLTNKDGVLTVDQKQLVIRAASRSKTYGDEITFTGTSAEFETTELINGNTVDRVTLTSTGAAATATVASGPYPIIPNDATGTGLANYEITYNDGVLTVDRKVLNVTNTNRSKVYGVSLTDVDFTGSINGLENADDITLTRNSIGANASADAGKTYPIIATLADPDNKLVNYNLTNNDGILTVDQKQLVIRAASRNKTYGDAITFTGTSAEFETRGLTNGNTVDGVTLTSTGAAATATVAAGPYSIIPKDATGTGLANYEITYNDGMLTVDRKVLNVTNTNRSKVYGVSLTDVDFTGSINGLENADDITLTRNSIGANASADAGKTYPIIATLADPDNKLVNYNLTNNDGILTVDQKQLVITAISRSKTYGDAITFTGTSAEFATTGLINGNTVDGVTLTSTGAAATATVAAGPYPIIPKDAKGTGLANYEITYNDGVLTVDKKALTITNFNRSKVYGELLAETDFDGSISGAVYNDDITLTRNSIGADAAAATGKTYPIVATLKDPDNKLVNYTLTNNDGVLTVDQKRLVITAASRSKTYGDEITFTGASAEFETTGLINGNTVDGVTLTSTGAAATATVAAGPYPIIPKEATGTGLANYEITYNDGMLTVDKKALTITANDQERFQGAVNPTLTVNYNPFVNNETEAVVTTKPNVSTDADANSPIGNYLIKASGAYAANYNITYKPGLLKVKSGAPTNITLTNVTLYENSPAGTRSGTLNSVSDDTSAGFTYTLVSGSGDDDNALFTINGDQISTVSELDYETKSIYSIRIRSTTQYGLYLEKTFTITLNDVNEAPTMATIANQSICFTTVAQKIDLKGISAGPEAGQTVTLSVTSSNPNLFEILTIKGTGSTGILSYKIKAGVIAGTANVTVLVKDDGDIENGGVDTYSQTFSITVNALPVVSISSDKGTQISNGETILLNATGGSKYTWTANGSSIIGGNMATLEVRPKETTTYTVTAVNANGCQDVKSFTLTVLDNLEKIKATNILSPNGDGYNDIWVVDNIDFYPDNEVKIFDKAGRIVYIKKGYDNSWDGTFNGTPLAEDTYYYIIDFGRNKRVFKGFITIIRQN